MVCQKKNAVNPLETKLHLVIHIARKNTCYRMNISTLDFLCDICYNGVIVKVVLTAP